MAGISAQLFQGCRVEEFWLAKWIFAWQGEKELEEKNIFTTFESVKENFYGDRIDSTRMIVPYNKHLMLFC